MHIRNTPGCLVTSKDYDKTRDFRIVALGRKYDTEIFLSPTKETCFLFIHVLSWWGLRSALRAELRPLSRHIILNRYFIAFREIYQNVCPEVPGNPRDVIFPDAEGGGKYNISGIPGNRGTNVLVYFPKSNKITVMLHFTRKNAWKIDPKF